MIDFIESSLDYQLIPCLSGHFEYPIKMDKLGNSISNILNHKMKKFNLTLALTILMVSLLKPVFGQDTNHWDFKISAKKDTIECGEKYTAYVVVKNKDIDPSKIEVMTNGVQLKRDSSGGFIYQQVSTDFEPALVYKKVNLEFKIKYPNMKEDVSLVHSYYIKDKNSLVDESENNFRGCQHPIIYPFQQPEFVPSNNYPTLKDYLISEIKRNNVILDNTLIVKVIVPKDGSLKYEKIAIGNTSSENLDKIIKIINNSPKWIPGDINGNKIDVTKHIRIN